MVYILNLAAGQVVISGHSFGSNFGDNILFCGVHKRGLKTAYFITLERGANMNETPMSKRQRTKCDIRNARTSICEKGLFQ